MLGLNNNNMNKRKHIVAKAAIGTYLFVLGIGLVFNSWEKSARLHNELLEIEINVNELDYYANEDVFNGNLNEKVKWLYLERLNEIEKSIKKLRNE